LLVRVLRRRNDADDFPETVVRTVIVPRVAAPNGGALVLPKPAPRPNE